MNLKLSKAIKTIVLFLFMASVFVSSLSPIPIHAGTTLIDSYLKVIQVSENSSSYKVKYEILKDFNLPANTGSSISIGYTWPTQLKGQLQDYSVKLNYKKGIYTVSLPKPKQKIISSVGLQATLEVAYGRDKEQISIGRFMIAPTGKIETFHEVTKTEAVACYVGYNIPNLYLTFAPQGKALKVAAQITGNIITGIQNIYGVATAMGYTNDFPAPLPGQYYQTISWYENFQLKTHTKIWQSKKAFNQKNIPIYEGTYNIDIP